MVRISLVSVLTPLYLYVSTPRSVCAVPKMAVFCSYLTSCFPVVFIIIIIILGISFMQGIYTYIRETNHVRSEQRVAAILVLLFMVLI